jgi:hypothetical protein
MTMSRQYSSTHLSPSFSNERLSVLCAQDIPTCLPTQSSSLGWLPSSAPQRLPGLNAFPSHTTHSRKSRASTATLSSAPRACTLRTSTGPASKSMLQKMVTLRRTIPPITPPSSQVWQIARRPSLVSNSWAPHPKFALHLISPLILCVAAPLRANRFVETILCRKNVRNLVHATCHSPLVSPMALAWILLSARKTSS